MPKIDAPAPETAKACWDVTDRVRQFEHERQARKQALFSRVLSLGLSLMLFGIGVFWVPGLLVRGQPGSMYHTMGSCMLILGNLVLVSGVLIVSTCPVDELDLDRFFAARARRSFKWGMLALPAVVSLALGVLTPPHVDVLSLVPQLWWLFGSRGQAKVTLVLAVWSSMHQYAFVVRSAFKGLGGAGGGLGGGSGGTADSVEALSNLIAAGGVLVAGVLGDSYKLRQHRLHRRTYGRQGLPPTLLFYVCLYSWLLLGAVALLPAVVGLFAKGDPEAWVVLARGPVCFGMPPMVVLVVGRDQLFGFMARRFDRQHAEKDGAFVAELLAQETVVVGQTWWVHRAAPNKTFPATDHRRNWARATVDAIDDATNTIIARLDPELPMPQPSQVTPTVHNTPTSPLKKGLRRLSAVAGAFQPLNNSRSDGLDKDSTAAPDSSTSPTDQPTGTPAAAAAETTQNAPAGEHASTPVARGDMGLAGTTVRVNVSCVHEPSAELLLKARKQLRCVDWELLSLDIMTGAICGTGQGVAADLYTLSRRLNPGECIDFFLSHSWHDDAQVKWAAMTRVAHDFRAKHHRSPTFWLDKVCIDQSNLTDGLKCLCVNVMACDKILVLCGPTYPKRLWCAWELFTLYAFQRWEDAVQRVELCTLDAPHLKPQPPPVPDPSPRPHSDSGALENGPTPPQPPPLSPGAAAQSGAGPEEEFTDMLEQLARFDVQRAHCYDPNEEAKLRAVIEAVSRTKFNESVQNMGRELKQRHQRARSQSWSKPRTLDATNTMAGAAAGSSSSGLARKRALTGPTRASDAK